MADVAAAAVAVILADAVGETELGGDIRNRLHEVDVPVRGVHAQDAVVRLLEVELGGWLLP